MQSLFTPVYSTSVIDALFNEVVLRSSNYYYFVGRANEWSDEQYPPIPVDNEHGYKEVRKAIVFLKKIQPSDISYLVRRIDWEANTVFDMYDDRYGTEIIGVNIDSGGSNYVNGDAYATISGNGSNANISIVVSSGSISKVIVNDSGSGYTSGNVSFFGNTGSGASGNIVLAVSESGKTKLKDCNFYVITDEYNVYKCLDNNLGAESNIKPTLTITAPFTTSDGYKWKFLYRVPDSLRNKFLTTDLMPVATSLTGNFYANGTILSATVLNGGDGYTSANTTIVVEGNGYTEGNPRAISGANVFNAGDSFTSTATLTVDDPFTTTAWASASAVSSGSKLKYLSNIYNVQASGTTGNTGPVHLSGTNINGTALLKFVGNTAILTANVNFNIANIAVATPGNYSTAAQNNTTATISTAGPFQPTVNATAIINYSNANVSSFVITQGAGYTYAVKQNTIVTIATTGDAQPSENATANINFTLGSISNVAIVNPGYGYGHAPNVTVTGGANANIVLTTTKTSASLVPVISSNSIAGVQIVDGGIGYTYATANVVGDGEGAKLLVDFSYTTGSDSLQVLNEQLAVGGSIDAIKIISNGYGYTSANATITGSGTGATANVTISNGRIVSINIVSPGSGYKEATVTISGDGKGAAARAILPPYGGHGFNAVRELFASNVGIYSAFFRIDNKGFETANDYRRIGIVKNIRKYTNDNLFSGTFGSACWSISGVFTGLDFPIDTELTQASTGGVFLVIDVEDNRMIVISKNGIAPVVGTITNNNNTFSITAIDNPDVDVFSGDIVYLLNKDAFTVSGEQAVTVRTVLGF